MIPAAKLSWPLGKQKLIAQKSERGHDSTGSGLVAENLFHQLVDLLVERPERNAGRADFFTKAAVDAASRHMHSSNQVKRSIGRKLGARDELHMLEAAFGAKAHRADIPASMASNAPVEMAEPPVEPFIHLHLVQFLDSSAALRNRSNAIPVIEPIGIGLPAFAARSQILTACLPKDDYLVAIQLIPFVELFEPSLFTASHKDAVGLLRIISRNSQEKLEKRIPGESRPPGLELVCVFFREEPRHGKSVESLISPKPVYPTFI
jgi:hypothetical protein